MAPYNIANALSDKLDLNPDEFFAVIEALQAYDTEKEMNKAAEIFNTLSKNDLVLRAKRIAKLAKMLTLTKINGQRDNVLSSKKV
jgi:hypothetical protein